MSAIFGFDNELKQETDETMSAYYKRVRTFMHRVGARDGYINGESPLSLLDSTILDLIVHTFVRGLSDAEVMRHTLRGLSTIGKSLHGVWWLALEANRAKVEKASQ